MPVHIVQRDDLDHFVNQMTADGVEIISVVHDQTPAESALGLTGARFLVITKPALRGHAEIEVRS